jgi:tRNA-uridine 2-sulfurtransferase
VAGVDSSVSAVLLQQLGYNVHAFFMELPLAGGCAAQAERVRILAARLGMPFSVVDLRRVFADRVCHYFVQTYLQGSTPNPCVICNQQVKFGALFDAMHQQGIEHMATGHYARIGSTANGTPVLRRGLDTGKDQSYFLCRLSGETLSRLVLPLGELHKEEVYRLADGMGLKGLHGPESQDVCFLAGTTVADFIAGQGIPEKPGEIVTDSGQVIGRHRGLWRYTVGQRRGLNLPDATPWYVRELDPDRNRLVVCKNEGLLAGGALLRDVRWTGEEPEFPWRGLVQIRGRHRPVMAELVPAGAGEWKLTFSQKQRAITPGQFAVFYAGDAVLGSGIITAAPGARRENAA